MPLRAATAPRRNAPQEAGKIVGDMVDVGRVAAGKLPFRAEDFSGA
jgi:hypothetical protein